MSDKWYWAAKLDGDSPVGNAFIVAKGSNELWRRVNAEFHTENVHWMEINEQDYKLSLKDVLNMFIVIEYNYGVNRNRFMLEMIKIPIFAKFMRESRKYNLCNYVSNPIFVGPVTPTGYDADIMTQLEAAICEKGA
jgi:hypothetical protein